jgi:hypothetical protein
MEALNKVFRQMPARVHSRVRRWQLLSTLQLRCLATPVVLLQTFRIPAELAPAIEQPGLETSVRIVGYAGPMPLVQPHFLSAALPKSTLGAPEISRSFSTEKFGFTE